MGEERAAQAAALSGGVAGEVAPATPAGALTRAQADRVIHRALELSDREPVQGEPLLGLAELEEIAAQVGIDRQLLQQALVDVRLHDLTDHAAEPERWLLGPRRVRGGRLVPGSPQEVRRAVGRWMAEDEGMTRTGVRGDAERWVKDGRVLVALQRGLGAQRSDGVLRGLPAVTVTVDPGADGAAAPVVVEADTTVVRQAGGATLAAGSLISAGLGAMAAALLPDAVGPDVVQAVVGTGAGLAATGATAAAITRSWTRRVRTAIDRALDGIAMSSAADGLDRPPAPTSDGVGGSLLRWLGGHTR